MGNRVELDAMGKKILDIARTDLFLSMRFLGPALHSLGFVMDLTTTSVGTDAAYIRFNPNYLLRLYADRPRLLNRTYLHMLLHCVFRHMFTAREKEDRDLWDLACDIAVGAIIDSMDYAAVSEIVPDHRQRVYDRLAGQIHVLTAERIYQHMIERQRNYLEELQLRQIFALCDHGFWDRMEDMEEGGEETGSPQPEDNREEGKNPGGKEPEDNREEEKNPGGKEPEDNREEEKNPGGKQPESGREEGNHPKARRPEGGRREGDGPGDRNPRDGGDADKGKGRPPGGRHARREEIPRLRRPDPEELEGRWKETSRRMEAEILASGKEASDERGSLDRILSISNRRRTDYREFLRRFAVLREVAAIDPDSFDYGFYNYGMDFYGNMPLIEENETREIHQVRTLAIAIDTSASCQEVLVQRFLNETAALLRGIRHFFHAFEVHVIECDEHVQKTEVFRQVEDLMRYADGFRVKGGFGTDFRPVFAYLEEKRACGEIEDLAGLMYFTDGMGVYPAKPTDYDTAFVFFNDEELDDARVPDWAIRLYIDGDRLRL